MCRPGLASSSDVKNILDALTGRCAGLKQFTCNGLVTSKPCVPLISHTHEREHLMNTHIEVVVVSGHGLGSREMMGLVSRALDGKDGLEELSLSGVCCMNDTPHIFTDDDVTFFHRLIYC